MMLAALADPVISWEHFITFFAGSTALGIVAHAVNTAPTPKNVWGQWVLGIIKYTVGQRISAINMMQGNSTMVVAVPQGTGPGLTKSAEQSHRNIDVTPETIKVTDEKTTKTETTLPNPSPPKEGE
jgi:hypothetical protein